MRHKDERPSRLKRYFFLLTWSDKVWSHSHQGWFGIALRPPRSLFACLVRSRVHWFGFTRQCSSASNTWLHFLQLDFQFSATWSTNDIFFFVLLQFYLHNHLSFILYFHREKIEEGEIHNYRVVRFEVVPQSVKVEGWFQLHFCWSFDDVTNLSPSESDLLLLL